MSFAVYPDNTPSSAKSASSSPAPQAQAAQFSVVEAFVQTRIKELIEVGWSWKAIAGALGITVEQAQWYAGYR